MASTGIRILALDDSPFVNRSKGECLVVGIIGRDNIIEGVISFKVDIDGTNASDKLIKAIRKTRFSTQIKVVALNGVSLAGLNIVDMKSVSKKLKMHVIGITRKKPHPKLLERAINISKVKNAKERIMLLRSLAKDFKAEKIGGFYVQHSWTYKEVEKILPNSVNLLRLANMVARGVSRGESKGRI